MQKPNFMTRVFFWLMLGLLSTFFAEFLSGSAPDFLLTAFGYWGIFPIYMLHTVLLASLILRKKRQFSLRSLYFASLLFGMYEAYITKVIWAPPWNPDGFHIANIALVETLLLVLFWHSVFSFLIPILIGETLLTDSRHLHALLPQKLQVRIGKQKTAILFGGIASILFAAAVTSIDDAISLTLLNCIAATLAILVWRFFTHKKQYDILDLLPRKWEVVVLAFLLLLVYLNFGFNLNRQVHPGFTGHLAVLALYAAIITFAIISVKTDKTRDEKFQEKAADPAAGFQMKNWFLFCGSLLISSIGINLLPEIVQELLSGMMFVVYIAAGIIFLALSIRDLGQKKPAPG